jgi:predicted aspartyl protease
MIRSLIALTLAATATTAAAEPLKLFNGRLFIHATVNGVETEALLDSGAEGTIVDPVLASKAKFPEGTPQVIKGSAGAEQARIVEGVTVNALGVELHPEAIVVLDLTGLSQRLIKRPTQAIIGRELFDAAKLRIDLAGGSISAVGKDSTPPGVKLPLTAHAGIEGIPVRANGLDAQAEFDLGNGSDAMISRDLVKKLKLPILGKKAGGGIGGQIQRDYVLLPTLEVAGRKFRNIHATIDDQPSHNDMNVGTSILKNFVITADFKDRAVWLAPIKPKRGH